MKFDSFHPLSFYVTEPGRSIRRSPVWQLLVLWTTLPPIIIQLCTCLWSNGTSLTPSTIDCAAHPSRRSTHFCAVTNVTASVRQIWWHSNSCWKKQTGSSLTSSATTLMTAFAVCFLPCHQRHNITNCAREHTTETYLKELGTSRTHAPYIHKTVVTSEIKLK